jgi:phenylacetate-CoA ligase
MGERPADGIGWLPFSVAPGLAWPALPPPAGQVLLGVLAQLDRSQWLPPDALRNAQFRQLRRLVEFAAREVPFYAGHLAAADLDDPAHIDPQSFLRWPLLAKADVQRHPDLLAARDHPARLGGPHPAITSGSTGHPLRVSVSGASLLVNHALQLRSHFWYGLDPSLTFANVRSAISTSDHSGWQAPTSLAFQSGLLVTLSSLEDLRAQLDWLSEKRPAYLLSNSSNLRALIETSLRTGHKPDFLKLLMGFGDLPSPDLGDLARRHWNVGVVDIYSCNEMGVIALQCPVNPMHHVQSEHVLLEILRPDGTPCEPGETGRVVVTDLQNFAMPLIRYELGDLAAPGHTCTCGRGLPTLQMIAGRTRDVAVDPTGRRFTVHMNSSAWTDVAPILQRQIAQTAADRLEIRYVAERPLTPAETSELRAEVLAVFRYDYHVDFVRLDSIPPGPGGKFSDFVSELPPQP